MIELKGQKAIKERIKDEEANIKATERDITPNNHEQSIGRKQGIEFAEEQSQSDLRAIKTRLIIMSTTINPFPLIQELISAIDSALEHKGEGSE